MEEHTDRWLLTDLSTVEEDATQRPRRVVAQLMEGWEPVSEVFDQYVNRDLVDDYQELPDHELDEWQEQKILTQGEIPYYVYEELQSYARGGLVCAFNLKKVFDDILTPDWVDARSETGLNRGFCVLRFAQKLLDPFPIQDNSLNALQSFYSLGVQNLHDPRGRIFAIRELFQSVLRPIAERKRLTSTYKIIDYCEEEWYPAILQWGKYKGQAYSQARNDEEMLAWLKNKAKSPNSHVARMFRWYNVRLQQTEFSVEADELFVTADHMLISNKQVSSDDQRHGIVLFQNTELKQLQRLVEWARIQLAEIEKQFDHLRGEIEKVKFVIRDKLFLHYKRRDSLRLKAKYLQIRIDMYMHPTDKTFEDIDLEYKSEEEKLNQEFEETKRKFEQRAKNEVNPAEVNVIYRTLAKLYHPDRQTNNATQKSHEQLMKLINRARREKNLKMLKEIAEDPRGFCLRNNIDQIQSEVEEDIEFTRRLYKHLQERRFVAITELNALKDSHDYELYQHSLRQPDFMDAVAKTQQQEIERECDELEKKIVELRRELDEMEDE